MKQGWEIKKLGEVCDIINGFAFKSNLFTDEGENILRISNIQNGYVDLADIAHFNKTDYPKINFEKYAVLEDDIVVALSGATTGKFGINKTGQKLYLNQRVAICRENIPTLNHLYLLYYLKTQAKSFLESAEGVAQPNLSTEQMKQYDILVPTIEEQERIVAELDCLSGVIEKKREQLKELDALAESIFYTMFGSVDDNHNNFDIKPLSDVFSLIKDGTHQTPQYTDDIENGIIFLSAKDVVSGEINWSNIKYIPKSLHIELHKRVAPQKNDILLCKNGTYGICALNETDEVFDIYVSLALLRPNDICMPKYLVYAINNKSTKLQFDKSIKGIGVPNLHLGEIKKTCIIVPPLELQQVFADKIEAIEKQKALIKQSISETEELFNSRMAYYFN